MKHLLLTFAMALCLASCSTDKEYHIETSDGVILYAHVRGRGEPCLYLHGGPGSGSTWMKEMGGKELEKRFTMVYLDQRGVCRSSEPADDNFSLSRQTLDFEEVREALGFDRWHLLGHSFGGILEIAYWRDYPESIRGMIFEDCTLSMSDCLKDSWLPAAIEIVGENVDPVAKDTAVDVKVRLYTIQRQLNNDTRALIFTREENKHISDTLNSWTFHKDCINHEKGDYVMGVDEYWADFRPLAATVTVPVLFFVGKYDRAIGPDSWKDLQFPDAVIKVGDCGHFPFLESPEEWSAALDEYQNKVRESAGRSETCKVYGEGVFVDLPGYGKSDKPDGVDDTLQYFADAFPGEVGIAMISGRDTICVNGDCHFPMFSVVKFHQALAVCDHFRTDGTEMPMETKRLLESTLIVSDNSACDILFETITDPSQVEEYIHNLGIRDCGIAWTEAEQHADISRCYENWTTPLSAARLLGDFYADRERDSLSAFLWETMEQCSTGTGRIPKYISGDFACIAHKTGTGGPLPDGGVMGINDIACIVLPDGSHFELAVFIKDASCDAPTCEEMIAKVARICYESICKR